MGGASAGELFEIKSHENISLFAQPIDDAVADTIVNDLLDYEASLETSSTLDVTEIPPLTAAALEGHHGPAALATLMRESSATSTFSATSAMSGGEGAADGYKVCAKSRR